MTAPPAKRRKTRVALSNCDREDATALSAGQLNVQEPGTNPAAKELALRSRTRSGQGLTKSTESTALPRSPKKQAPRPTPTRTRTRDGPKLRSVDGLFNSSLEQKMFAQRLELFDLDQLEDAIEDDSVLEEELRSQGSDFATAAEATKNRAGPAEIPLVRKNGRSSEVRKFLSRDIASGLAAAPSTSASRRPVEEDARPWVDRYRPLGLDELAVHAKKVDDVRRWILDSFAAQSQKVSVWQMAFLAPPTRTRSLHMRMLIGPDRDCSCSKGRLAPASRPRCLCSPRPWTLTFLSGRIPERGMPSLLRGHRRSRSFKISSAEEQGSTVWRRARGSMLSVRRLHAPEEALRTPTGTSSS